MDPVHESGPWTRSKVGVHGPLVHVCPHPICCLGVNFSEDLRTSKHFYHISCYRCCAQQIVKRGIKFALCINFCRIIIGA